MNSIPPPHTIENFEEVFTCLATMLAEANKKLASELHQDEDLEALQEQDESKIIKMTLERC